MSGEMSTEIMNFDFDGNNVRVVVDDDGDPWWIAGDVCRVLDISNVGHAMTRLDDDEKGSIVLNDGTPGTPNRAIINESGLYSLILASRKPEAKKFKRWVTRDVLPQIRKTGAYAHDSVIRPTDSVLTIQSKMFSQIAKEIDAIKERTKANEERVEQLGHDVALANDRATEALAFMIARPVAMISEGVSAKRLDPAQYLSAAQLSDMTSIPLASVYQGGASGRIPGRVKAGRSVLFRLDAVMDWWVSRKNRSERTN